MGSEMCIRASTYIHLGGRAPHADHRIISVWPLSFRPDTRRAVLRQGSGLRTRVGKDKVAGYARAWARTSGLGRKTMAGGLCYLTDHTPATSSFVPDLPASATSSPSAALSSAPLQDADRSTAQGSRRGVSRRSLPRRSPLGGRCSRELWRSATSPLSS